MASTITILSAFATFFITNWKAFPIIAILSFVVYCLYHIIYNLYFHELRSYPGPWLARATSLAWIFYQVRGRLPHILKVWHDKYGTAIRVSPNALSYTDSQAWFDIHGHKVGDRGWFERDPAVYPQLPGRAPSILLSSEQDHGRFRRSLSHAFSDKELRNQEPLIQSYVDLMITKLKGEIESERKGILNISNWLNYITFDIIGDLSFGEPFGCLESGVMHPWVEIMFSSLRDIVFLAALSHLPTPIYKVIMSWVHWFVLEDLEKDRKFSAERVHRRLQHGTARSDFMSPILRRNDEKRGGMTVPEIEASFNILVVAGSETNATLLSGVLYTLSKNPDIKAKLMAELTSTFPTRNHVNIEQLADLPYLNAVLEEGLRIYPPSAFNQARVVPQEGAIICGKMVPPGTAVGVATWAASRAKTNWTQPEKFMPERWLGDGLPGDDRKSMQPFILGPRGCLGKNLAYAEMRLILSNFLLEFDYDVQEQSNSWILDQRFYLLWERPPLMIKLRLREKYLDS